MDGARSGLTSVIEANRIAGEKKLVDKLKIGSIVIRCFEFDKMLAFWREALGYTHTEPVTGGWVILRDPEGTGPNVSLDQSP